MEEVNSGYSLKLTSIGSGSWQLFLQKIDDSSDFVRVAYGTTEQVGGGARKFKLLRSIIISPGQSKDPLFIFQFEEHMMKNRRVWMAFEAVKRVKNIKGAGVGTYIALSPAQSKWYTSIGSTTPIEIKQLGLSIFTELYSGSDSLGQNTKNESKQHLGVFDQRLNLETVEQKYPLRLDKKAIKELRIILRKIESYEGPYYENRSTTEDGVYNYRPWSSPIALEAMDFLIENNLKIEFAHTKWEGAKKFVDNKDKNKFNKIDRLFILKFLSAVARSSRFIDGEWERLFDSGYAQKLFERLLEIEQSK